MGYIELTQADIKLQNQLLTQYRSAYAQLPEGNLTYKKIKGKVYYYLIDKKGDQHYINKEHSNLVYDLTYKKYLYQAIKRIENNLLVQKRVMGNYQSYTPQAICSSLPKTYTDALSFLSSPSPQPLTDDNYYPKGKIYRTTFGMSLRSKSEVLIAELLHAANIPFQYEAPLRIQTASGQWITYRPDFTITLPTGKIIYWEHAGLFMEKNYQDRFFEKLANYHRNHIIMPDSLIVTMDGPDGSLDIAAINRIIQGQLVPLF